MSNTEQYQIGHFGFSAIHPSNLGASRYTLVTIAADRSGSTSGFQQEMENCIKEAVKACQMSPFADNLLLRVLAFDSKVTEIHGFKQLQDINLATYDGILTPGGSTVLYDAHLNAIEATANYGKELNDQDYEANAIVFIITDGCDERSVHTTNSVMKSLGELNSSECLESFQAILLGINMKDKRIAKALEDVRKSCGYAEFKSVDDADAETLAKIAKFIENMSSSTSQALGTGGPSRMIEL